MPEAKPRRSIFDTLKKSAGGRLGLAEAATMAEKISVFPSKIHEPPYLPQNDPTSDPTRPSAQGSGQPSDHPSGQELGHLSGHDPTHDPTGDPTVGSNDPTPDPTLDPTPDPTGRSDPTPDPTLDPTIKKIIRGLSENKRRFLHHIIDHEPAADDYIISRQLVGKTLHITEISVKRYFAEFADLGFFRKETYRHGVCQGVRLFLARARCAAFKKYDPTPDPTLDPTGGSDPANDPTPDPTGDPTFIRKIDRKNLSISLKTLRLTWPHLAMAGFGPQQIEQITANLTGLGKSTDRLVQGLDHAEWELANARMLDKDGERVTDPCAWVFRALSQTGYYRRPKGYVSPEEQAARDAEEEARAVIAARQKAEQAQFEAWRDGLGAEALREAMQGHPGGNKDAWLKRVWREKNKPRTS